MLRYTTTQTAVAPLRIVTADTFDGETWKPGTTDVSRRNRAAKGLPNPPGLTDAIARQAYTMRIDVSPNLDQDFLPLPYPARKVDIDGAWLYDAASLNVLGEGETVRDKSYSVDYLDVTPTADQARAAPAAAQDTMQRYVRLPSSLPDVVRQRALEVTQGASTAYDQAMALQEWFRSKGGFTYSTQAPADSGGDAVADFLQSKQGFCIQFASAMATMSRSLGIPARIGVGFLPGTPDGQNTWSVRLTDAHAWPEPVLRGRRLGAVRADPRHPHRRAPAWAAPATTGGTSDTASTSGATDAATGSSATRLARPAAGRPAGPRRRGRRRRRERRGARRGRRVGRRRAVAAGGRGAAAARRAARDPGERRARPTSTPSRRCLPRRARRSPVGRPAGAARRPRRPPRHRQHAAPGRRRAWPVRPPCWPSPAPPSAG
ncbi:hypothetical protein GCM10025868_06850 [Angustibacter aerolatus]|uniref:Transglutaminase-like domain-containing protein n=1 Tax=Angustibacter aerolatus TaxID=1162965 RepID=A0ABQ6JF41_9ACTN|nr:hypothetical protein GCM10025868_06850 [Angustibacter aerolatus]